MPHPKAWIRKDAEVRKREILVAAGTLMLRHGPERMSMADIAAEAGVSRSALYQHFEGRERLFKELIALSLKGPLLRAQKAASLEAPLAERISSMLDAFLGQHYRAAYHSGMGRHLVEFTNELAGDVIESFTQDFYRVMLTVIEDASAEGEIDLEGAGFSTDEFSETLASAAHGIAFPKHDPLSPEEFQRRLYFVVNALVRGLAPKDP